MNLSNSYPKPLPVKNKVSKGETPSTHKQTDMVKTEMSKGVSWVSTTLRYLRYLLKVLQIL